MRLAVTKTDAENLFEILASKSPVGLYIIQDGRFCYTNPTFQSTTGYEEDELLGRDSLEYVVPEDREKVRENAIKTLKGELILPYQVRVTHKNGSMRWVTESVAPIQHRGRKATLGYFIDITERKQAEEALRTSEKTYKTVVEDAPIGIYYSDFNGTFLYGNKRAEEIVGYKVEELLGKSFLKLKLLRLEEIAKAAKLLALNKLGKATGPDRFILNRKDGTTRTVEIRTKVITVGGKKAILGMVEDITERKQAEKKLRESEENYRTIFENVSEVIIRLDRYGKILDVNGRAEEYFGYKPKEIIGKNFVKTGVLSLKDMTKMAKLFSNNITGKHALTTLELTAKRKDGNPVLVEVSPKPVKKDGKVEGFVAIIRDITERKQAEEARREAEEEKSALLEEAPVGILHVDPKGKIIYVNKRFESESGYSREEIVGKNGFQLDWLTADTIKYLAKRMAARLSGRPAKYLETQFKRKDGQWIWVEIETKVLRRLGVPVGIQLVSRNITDRKKADEAIQAEKNKLQALVNAIEYSLVVQDTGYNIVYQNEISRKLYGDHMGEKCYRIFEGNDKVCDGCPVEMAFKDGKSHTTERMTTIEGEVIFWKNTANPIMDAAGSIVSCLEIGENITKRKRAEEALQAEKNKLQSLIDAMTDTITIQDTEFNIIYQNEPSKIASGGDHIGEKCYRVYEGREKVCDGCPVEKAFKDSKPHTTERRTAIEGKTAFWENTANPIRDAEGRIVSCLEIARDITERKRAEEQLQENEQYLKTLFNASAGGILVIDPKTHEIVDANSTVIKMIGIERDQIIGHKCHKFVCPSEVGKCPITDLRQKVDSSERMLLKANGESVSVLKSVAPIIRHGRQYLLELMVDITEHKRAEEAIQTEKNKLQSVIDAMEDSLTIQDTEYNIIYQNEPARITFGDHLGEKCYRAYEGREKVCDRCPAEQAYKNGKSHTSEMQRLLPSGEVTIWETTANPIRDAKGKVASCLEIGRNITERKKAEETLKQTKTQLSSAVQLAHLGPWEYDAINDLFIFNDAFYELFHTTAEEVGGYTMSSDEYARRFVHPEDAHLTVEEGHKALQSDDPNFSNQFDHRIIYADGGVGYISVRLFIRKDETGRAVGIYGVNQDITARKQAEEVIQAEKNKLQSLIDAMTDALNIIGPDYTIIYQNEPSKRGTMGDHAGEKCYRVFEGNDKVCDGCPVEQAFKDGKPYISERRTVTSGKVGFWETTANPIRDAEGRIVSCLEIAKNITVRKRQEQNLTDELTRRRLLIDQSADGIVVIDENDKVYEANQRFADMLGYTLEEIHEMHTWDWEKNYSREQIHEQGRKADERGFFLETTHTRKDGSIIDVDISINASIIGGQKLIFCVCRDVTERKKAERALADELAQRRLLVDKSLDGIVVLDVNAKVVEANQRFADMLGYTIEEIRELHTWDWDKNFPPEQILEMGRNVDEKGLHLETKHTRKDGSIIDVDISISGIMYGGRKLIFCIQRDVTERKKMEEAIKHAAEEWRETFDSINDAISIHDRDHKILRANKAFAEIFHKKPSKVLGKHCYELHKGDKPISGCPHKQTLATKKPAEAEFYESNLGKYLHESTSPIFDENGEVIGTIHITRDVTKQKQQNEQLMMADRLASIGELAAGTAHELNNPLTSVIGFSQLLMERDIPDDIREDLNLIYNEAQRASGVTKNLLAFARKHSPTKQLTQVNNIIEDVLKLRAYEHKVNGIEVKIQLAPNLPEIQVDYFQIQQVLLNVIINAEYFMTETHNRGTLTITTKKQNGTIRISIADDGPGIPRENLSHIFDPFYTSKEAGKGTGLGLSICHGIVAEHDGKIYARSQPGKGATIFVELPLNSQ